MPITPINPYVPAWGTLPNVTPFTYRDGRTFINRLESIITYLNRVMVPYVNDNIQNFSDEFVTEINTLIDQVNTIVQQIIDSSVEAQDSVVAGIINDSTSATSLALIDEFVSKVSQDSLISAILNDTVSQSRVTLDNTFVSKINQDSLTASLISDDTSETNSALDLRFVSKSNQDSLIAGIISDIASQTFTVLDEKFVVKTDVTAYGVKGDGITDNTEALTTLFSTKNDIYFPAGTYVIKNSLKIRTGMRIHGAGKYLTTIKAHQDMPQNLNLIQTANITGLQHSNYVENIEISDLTVDGDAFNRPYTTALGENGSGIRLATVKNAIVKDVRSINPFQHCFDVTASVYFDDGNVNHNPQGMSQNVKFINCDAVDTLIEDGFTTHNSSDILISNCTAIHTKPLYSAGISNGFEIDEGSFRVVVDNCYTNGWVAGYAAKGHTTTIPAYDIYFVNCVAENCETSYQISSVDPASLPVGQTSVAKNVTVKDCVSIATVNKFGTSNYAVRVIGYEHVNIEDIVIRGGTMNHMTFTEGADFVVIDGVYAENVYSAPYDTERAFIHIFGDYGQSSLCATIKNVEIKGTIPNPAVRCSNANVALVVENLYANGSNVPWPVIFGNKAKGTMYRNIDATGFSDNISGWVSYDATPGANFVIGNGTIVSAFQADGAKIDFRISVVVGSTTSITGDINFKLPVNAIKASMLAFNWYAIDSSAPAPGNRVYGFGYPTASLVNTAMIVSNGNVVNSTVPFTWAAGDIIEIYGSYERQ